MVAAAARLPEKEGRSRKVRSLDEILALPKVAELTYDEAALFLGMNKRTLYNLCHAKEGPPRIEAIGKGVYFIKADLEAWDRSRKRTHRTYS
jgi:predicted DNA-binding transcriptional regulator AlpA